MSGKMLLPASKITDFGYTASYIRQASPELGGAPIIMTDVGPGGIVNGPIKICRTYDVVYSTAQI